MAYRLPPFSTFRTFEAAARHLSFKKAAEELHVTPAAVSQQIKSLESFLGISLFERLPKALQLTEEGLAMYPKVRDGMDCFAAAVESTRLSAAAALNVTAPPAFATRWLVPRLTRFSQAHAEVAIRISSTPENIDGPQTALEMTMQSSDSRHEASEVAIRFGTGTYPGYQVEKILAPDYVLVCSPRLIDGDAPLRTPQDLVNHILIHDESIPAAEQRPSWHEWLKLAGVSGMDTERGPRFSNAILAQEAAAEGQGVALALRPQVEAEVAAGRLVIPFVTTMPSAYAYYLVIPKAIAERAVVRAFKDWLQTEVGAPYGS
ncbi:MAG: transcriptional regulator GcvA [Azonexus sp.]|nr:transcriptional regulator GcvA [Azonexus sp.]